MTQGLPTAVDLFAGAGGLSLGLERAGISSLIAIDHFDAAVKTYNRNQRPIAVSDEISPSTRLPVSDVIVGGPPCQGFSSAGQRKAGDSRNTLVSVYSRLIADHKPRLFVFENVEGFLTAESGDRVIELLDPLIEAGYWVHLRKINAANYGVPQHRKRVIGIGGLGFDPGFPQFTHSAFGAPGSHLAASGLPPALTVDSALRGLPKPGTEGAPQGHQSQNLDDDDMRRVTALKPGQTMRDLPPDYWHESYRRRAFRRVSDGTPTENRGGAPAGIRRLIGSEPSKAITSGARAEFVHPTENRYLTLRECARIQTFPDDFEFLGTLAEQTLMIGNAVPPLLGEAVGRHLQRALLNAIRPASTKAGSLLSFIPTSSNGMSPALQKTVSRIEARYRSADRNVQGSFAWG